MRDCVVLYVMRGVHPGHFVHKWNIVFSMPNRGSDKLETMVVQIVNERRCMEIPQSYPSVGRGERWPDS